MPQLKSALIVFICINGLLAPLNAQDKNPHPLMKDFIGINARASDDLSLLQHFDFVREYHEWSDDAGYDADGVPNCPTNLLRYNPSNSKAGVINYDAFYQTLSGKVAPSMKGVAPEMIGLKDYDAVLQEQKPICQPNGWVDQNAAETYLDFSKWVSLFSMRYGSNPVCDNLLTADFCQLLNHSVVDGDVLGAGKSGLGFLKFLEMGNEPDKWWYDGALRNTPDALYQMLPAQYAALLHAAYDGGGKASAFKLPGSNANYLGVKNIDPNVKVVMGGLSDFRGRYLIEMLEAGYNLRAGNAALTKKIPFDVLNLHHYCSNVADLGAAYIDNPAIWDAYDYYGLNSRGLSPEQSQLKARYVRFFEKLLGSISQDAIKNELAGSDMEFWLTEFGYDTNNGSPIKAQLASGSQSYFTTQAQWLVRSFLELSAVEYPWSNRTLVLQKAAAFDLRDGANFGEGFQYSPGGSLFTHCGLVTRNFQPKRAWYYVQTLKNILGNTRFVKDLNANNSIQFDNGGTAPRIYYYKSDDNQRILAIWSPTATKVTNRLLTLPVSTLLASIGETELTNLTSYSVIQMADNAESGVKKGFVVTNGQLKLNTTTAPVSETPIFVVLNTNQSDEVPACPLTTTPSVQPFCNGALLEWDPKNVPAGHWNVYYAQKSNLANNSNCQVYASTDLLGNGYVQTYVTGLQSDRGRLLIEGLKSNTQYVVFLSFVNAAGVAATLPCVVCLTTNTNTLCLFNPCMTLTAEGSCEGNSNDFCRLAVENRGPATNYVCPESAGVNCVGGNPNAVIQCGTYNAAEGCGQPFLYPSTQLWSSCTKPEVTVTFDHPILLNAIRFYHHSGSDPIDIYYSTCTNPDKKRFLLTFQPNSCNAWISLVKNMPAEAVKRLYFQKRVPLGKAGLPDVKIGKLHFCGTLAPDCNGKLLDAQHRFGQIEERQEAEKMDTLKQALQIFPNPAQNKVQISWSSAGFDALQLFDLQGRMLESYVLSAGQQQLELSIIDLPAAVYCIKLSGSMEEPRQSLLVVNHP